MLMRFDPFRELDRFTQQTFGTPGAAPTVMPMDAYRRGDQFIVHFDLPGVDSSSIDLTVERNVLTVAAQRNWPRQEGQEVVVAERPQGKFSRQLFLGESLDADRLAANYDNGVLTLTVPIAEQAKARKVEVSSANGQGTAIEANSSPT
jgi:HSP20 family protein